MFTKAKKLFASAALGSLLIASVPASADDHASYHVTITNVTHSITFTPILVTSHKAGVSIFEPGAKASDELTAIAEGGNVAPLTALLNANADVVDVQNSGSLLLPGESVTVLVDASEGAKYISLASMMLPTNDGFIALNSVSAPKKGTASYYSPGYDAGTETNDELCVSIPGPTCGGAGPSLNDHGEGYIHINRGIQGIADLSAATYDWRNPVARITIERVKAD